MAKKRTDKLADNVEALRPYVERALKDENVRKNLREAVAAAQNIYGDLSKVDQKSLDDRSAYFGRGSPVSRSSVSRE